jgi:antibiotic biosynthesis monooxygenase (ABM) superfamily enzyme
VGSAVGSAGSDAAGGAPGLQAAPEAEQVTAIIQHDVLPYAVQRYERWLERIMPAAAAFPGHGGVSVVRPPARGPRRYSVAVRFDSLDHAQSWFGSEARRALLQEAAELLVRDETVSTLSGLELWFGTPPGRRPPARWKMFLVTVAAIYPLTLLVPWALQPLLSAVAMLREPLLHHLVVALAIVALMTWVVMPRLTRHLAGWLNR